VSSTGYGTFEVSRDRVVSPPLARFAEVGFLDEDGEPRPAAKVDFVAVNSARLALARLDDNLVDRNREKGAALRAHLAEHYGSEDRP
jgi:hypothetical protein